MRFFSKHILLILLIVLFSLISCHRLFHKPFYTSHDGEGHVIRMIEYDESLKDGQVPVRIAKRINYGLGYPFFNFNYPLPYFIGEVIHGMGFSFVNSFKLLFIVSALTAGLSMYLFIVGHFGRLPAFISAIFYTFVPYKFLNMYVRGNPAESMALALVPLLFYSADRCVDSKGKRFGMFVIITLLFVLSHNTTVLITVPIFFLYIAGRIYMSSQRRELVKIFFFSFLLILLSTSFFWVPIAFEAKLTKLSELSEDYAFFFPTFKEVIYSPWGFGGYKQGFFPGKMSPQIGLLHITAFIASCILVVVQIGKHKCVRKEDWFPIYLIGIVFLSLFFMLPGSGIIWNQIVLLKMVQLPWRFLGIISLGCSVLAGYVIYSLHLHARIALMGVVCCVIALLYVNRNHMRVNQYTEFVNPFETNLIYRFSTTSKDEHMPRLAPRIHENPNPDGDAFPPNACLSKRTGWKTNYHEFVVEAIEPCQFRDNTSYFPGWVAFIDGVRTPILYEQDDSQRLRIRLEPGSHTVIFRFGEPWYRMLSDIVSGVTIVYILVGVFLKKGRIL